MDTARRHIILCCDCEGTREQLERLSGAINGAGVTANYFFVGETAQEFPEFIREVGERHQVASHTMRHENLRRLNYEEQRETILAGRAAVEEALGRPAPGFRAPFHALNRDTLQILADNNFGFDASGLYYRYNYPPGLKKLEPDWFREWMPLFDTLHLKASTPFLIFKYLVRTHHLTVLPAHPHYAGRDERVAAAFGDFLKWGGNYGAKFWKIDDWLECYPES